MVMSLPRVATTAAAIVGLAALGLAATGTAGSAAQNCTRLAFSVNDYGKDGPTKDAKELLDKYIVKWTGERNIKKYSVGKKDVECELFLNFIVFDEHTCKASAPVCWDGPPVLSPEERLVPPPVPAVKSKAPRVPVKSPAKAPAAAATKSAG